MYNCLYVHVGSFLNMNTIRSPNISFLYHGDRFLYTPRVNPPHFGDHQYLGLMKDLMNLKDLNTHPLENL